MEKYNHTFGRKILQKYDRVESPRGWIASNLLRECTEKP
jgi:hypothetical protein